MRKRLQKVQAAGEPGSNTALVYASALLVGAALIATRSASPAEASGYAAPFLVAYERGTAHHMRPHKR